MRLGQRQKKVTQTGCAVAQSPKGHRNGPLVAGGLPRGAEVGEVMTVKHMAASARRGVAGGGLTMERSGWWHSVPEKTDGERGRSSGDGGMRCGLLRGPGGSFYRVGRGVLRQW
jgi:hypothetical protein